MLNKLLKYDLKSIYSSLIPYYISILIASLLLRIISMNIITLNNSDIGSTFLTYSFYTLGIILLILIPGLIVNNVIKLWTRFINNIYKDESYLTHTLPITRSQIYLSKFLTSIFTMITSVLIILLALFIVSTSMNGLNSFDSTLKFLTILSEYSILINIIIVLLVYGVEVMNIIQIGYAGIILGHKSNNKKIIKSFIYGSICYMAVSGLSLLIVYLIGLFNPSLLELFMENKTPTMSVIKFLLIGITLMYIVIIIIFYIINNKLIRSGVNVE